MKIGQLAARANLSASAIRYYEKRGLLAAPQRIGGQRRYPSESLDRVLLIRFATDMGFPLAEIKLFLSGLRAKMCGPRVSVFNSEGLLADRHRRLPFLFARERKVIRRIQFLCLLRLKRQRQPAQKCADRTRPQPVPNPLDFFVWESPRHMLLRIRIRYHVHYLALLLQRLYHLLQKPLAVPEKCRNHLFTRGTHRQ